ncbi:3-phosphoshikimate 1-carboxyvinyltransferase [Candidatus Sumerlaeota bacterium]|nr:3-phosphoshikimate 1-carboxyvinyltransferase [Candidatus Sumerlaeota bacterium]
MNIWIDPCANLKGRLRAQPSKNYTTRYLLASALARGESVVHRPAKSDDALALTDCLISLGAQIRQQGDLCIVKGFGNTPRNPGILNPRNAGAVLRLLLGVASLLPEVKFITDFPESLGKRPNQDLLDSLSQLGVKYESREGRLPITIRGGSLHGGRIQVSGAKSSQFLSSLLFLAPLIGEDVEIGVVEGLKSKPLIGATLEVMRAAGVIVQASPDLMHFRISGGQEYQPGEYKVNGDWPGSAALLSAAAVCPSSDIEIEGLFDDEQGEKAIVDVLRSMGADISYDGYRVRIRGGKALHGVEFDGDRATDAVLAMVGASCLAEGTSRFYNVENLRLKECDRISEPLIELKRLGVRCEERKDEIIIQGDPKGYAGGIEVNGRGDHRVIMLLTILGLRSEKGLTITGAQNIAKSYPDFFRHIEILGARINKIEEQDNT